MFCFAGFSLIGSVSFVFFLYRQLWSFRVFRFFFNGDLIETMKVRCSGGSDVDLRRWRLRLAVVFMVIVFLERVSACEFGLWPACRGRCTALKRFLDTSGLLCDWDAHLFCNAQFIRLVGFISTHFVFPTDNYRCLHIYYLLDVYSGGRFCERWEPFGISWGFVSDLFLISCAFLCFMHDVLVLRCSGRGYVRVGACQWSVLLLISVSGSRLPNRGVLCCSLGRVLIYVIW